MTPIDTISPYLEGELKSDFTSWQIGENGFEFDSAIHPEFIGKLTTSFVMNNNLLAKLLLIDGPFKMNGWKNKEDSRNVFLIENAFHISKYLYDLKDWRINIPEPNGLYLIKRKPMNSFYPAFVMRYVYNNFFEMPREKQRSILEVKNQMFDAVKEYGVFPSPFSIDSEDNFIYSKFENRVYLIGFSLWKKK